MKHSELRGLLRGLEEVKAQILRGFARLEIKGLISNQHFTEL